MAWADVLTTYHAHLVAAGAAVSPAITTVVRGEPTALTTVPVIAYWWGGIAPGMVGPTLSQVSQAEGLVTTVYVPDSVRLTNRAQTIEDYLRDIILQIHARLWGDAHLGENAIAIGGMNETSVGFAVLSNTVARTATFTCWVDLVDVHSIAN